MRPQVRDYFDRPENYVGWRPYIDARTEILRDLCGELRELAVLDVGCGDGSLSIPFLEAGNRVAYVDALPAMIEAARALAARVPAAQATFEVCELERYDTARRFDLILALGVLAHVESPEALIERLAGFLAPGGRLVLQYTDAERPMGALLLAYDERRVRPRRGYPLNRLRSREVAAWLDAAGLSIRAHATFGFHLPGWRRLPKAVGRVLESTVRRPGLRWLATDRLVVAAGGK